MATRLGRSAKASIWIEAPPEAVWEVVTDVTRGGEWSCESQGCEWLNGATSAQPGARFRGRNTRRGINWSRTNQVMRAERPREFVWRTLPTFQYRDSTEWRIGLEPERGGTTLTEGFQMLHMSRPFEFLVYWLFPAHRDRQGDLLADLHRLKTLLESSRPQASLA